MEREFTTLSHFLSNQFEFSAYWGNREFLYYQVSLLKRTSCIKKLRRFFKIRILIDLFMIS